MSLTWTELEDGLAARLPYLAVLDTFVLEIENTGALIQLRQEHDHLRSESWPFRHRFADTVVPPETSQALLASVGPHRPDPTTSSSALRPGRSPRPPAGNWPRS
jgi:hypothetical protein